MRNSAVRAIGVAITFSAVLAAHGPQMTGVSIDVGDRWTEVEVRANRHSLRTSDARAEIARRLKLRFDGAPAEYYDTYLGSEPSGPMVIWRAVIAAAPRRITIAAPVFADQAQDRTVITVTRLCETIGTGVIAPGDGPLILAEGRTGSRLRFLREGVLHVFTHADHILFLLVLLLPITRLRDTVTVIAAFTLAHSVALLLTTLGVPPLSPQLGETAGAICIICAAAENLLKRRHVIPVRTAYAFVYGVFHGLGFAGAFVAISLPFRQLVMNLIAINAGVEAGQLALLVVLVTLLGAREHWKARQHRRHDALVEIAGNSPVRRSGFCPELLLLTFSSLPDRPRQ